MCVEMSYDVITKLYQPFPTAARGTLVQCTPRTNMKAVVQKLRRILRSVVRESNYRHNPLLINSLAAFNFQRRLEFPGELLARYREFAQ